MRDDPADVTFTVDTDEMDRLGLERRTLHRGHKTSRELSASYQEIGIAGELAFEQWSGCAMDKTKRPRGDNWDFRIQGWRIDVKTTRSEYNPLYLLVEVGTVRNDIYVLAQYEGSGRITLLGYTNDASVANAPTKDFGRGIVNHYVAVSQLHSMQGLRQYLKTAKRIEPKTTEANGPPVSPSRLREIMLASDVGTTEQRQRWKRELQELDAENQHVTKTL